MTMFAIVAGIMAAILLAAGWRRPRPALFVAAVQWLAYAAYERLVATGVLCDAGCNIRVDLFLFFPILFIATAYAYRSFEQPPGQRTIVGMVLGAICLVILAMLAGAFGYIALAAVAGLGALAIIGYAIKSNLTANRV